MKRIMTRLAALLSILLISDAAMAVTTAKQYKGTTQTAIMKKNEVMNDLILEVNGDGNTKSVKLDGYAVLDKKNVSITADLTLDDKGTITKAENIVVKGAPAKIKNVQGYVSPTTANITLEGKAILIGFTIKYTATAVK